MTKSQKTLYQEAIYILSHASLQSRDQKKARLQDYIVATHGPALLNAVIADPTILNNIGWYRINCSHLGKEHHLEAYAKYLQEIHKFVPILLDLQGPKPRINELRHDLHGDISVMLGGRLEVRYLNTHDADHYCSPGKLRVCFPEIFEVMQVGDTVIFDDGKMTAIVREKDAKKAIIECSEIQSGDTTFFLGGRKGICVRNRPLGIDCITHHDRKSIEFARDLIGFDHIDNIMVSYFSTPADIHHFVEVIREYWYTGNLGGKFETPYAVFHADKILSKWELSLVMLGRGDFRVEMDPRAIPHMHDIQAHFFATCRKYTIESICATGFLESMLTPEGKVTPEEIYDMQESVLTGADHLMLSGESTYGAQAKNCIERESRMQKSVHEELRKGIIFPRTLPTSPLSELLYIH